MQIHKFIKTREGSVAIEAAICLPVILLLVAGLINFGLILIIKLQLNMVVHAGELYAFNISSDTAAVTIAMKNAVQKDSIAFNPSITVTQFCNCLEGAVSCSVASCLDGSTPGVYDKITASSSVSTIPFDYFIANPFTTTTTVTIRTDK